MAFFPFYPLLMRAVAIPLSPLSLFLPPWSVLLVGGVVINMAAFITAAVLLYLLTMEITHHHSLSLLSAALFCLTPASVFMSAVYTESVFVCLSFAGMLCVQRSKLYTAMCLFSLAAATRSNGVVLAGYIVYHHLLTLVNSRDCRTVLRTVGHMAIQVSVIVLPLVCFQVHGYMTFCTSKTHSYTPPPPPWCSWIIPFSYSSVQARYWGLGFLSYYRWKQLSNFLLSLPMTLLVVYCVYVYCVSCVGGVVSTTRQLL